LADHFQKRSLLLSKGVTEVLGVSHETARNWNLHHSTLALRFLPRIIQFLGYALYDPSWSFGERLTAARRGLGLPRQQLADALGVAESTVAGWEKGRRRPRKELGLRLDRLVSSLCSGLTG